MNKFEELVNADRPVLVDFFATWCGPCKMMHPELEKLHEKMGDAIKIITIDIDKNEALSTSLNVRSVPTLMLFVGGQLKWRGAGFTQAAELERIIKEHA